MTNSTQPCPAATPWNVMPESMAELDLIRQLGDRLGRPLEEIAEDRFERHSQSKNPRDWASQDIIKHDSYAMAKDGTVSGLFLAPVTSQRLVDFPFQQFNHVRHLHLRQVNLSSFLFLGELTELTSLDLSHNSITDCSFLGELTRLTALD